VRPHVLSHVPSHMHIQRRRYNAVEIGVSTSIGTAQTGHDAHGFGEKCSRSGGRVTLRAHFNNVNDALEDCFAPVTVVRLAHSSPEIWP